MLEVSDIQDFILNTAEATTSRPYTYLEQQEIVPETGSRLVFQLHSPLDMWVSTDSGDISSTTDEVDAALYRRVGEVQYIEVPETEEDIELHMVGQATGSFTLEIEHWDGLVLEDRVDYVAVPTATGTKVSAKIPEDIAQIRLKLDQEGDGIIEGEMTTEGEFVASAISYEDLISTINTLNLSRVRKQALLTLVRSAEYYGTKSPATSWYLILEDGLLKSSEDLIRLYVKKRYLITSDAEEILTMIKVLKNKQ